MITSDSWLVFGKMEINGNLYVVIGVIGTEAGAPFGKRGIAKISLTN